MFKIVKALVCSLLIAGSSAHATMSLRSCIPVLPYVALTSGIAVSLAIYAGMKWHLGYNATELENQKIVDFVRKEAALVTDKHISFFISADPITLNGLAAAFGDDAILISAEYYKIIEVIFAKEELSIDDHNALNILRFVIQHEVGHLVHNHMKKRMALTALAAAVAVGLFECSKKLIDFNYSQLLSVLAINTMSSTLLNKYFRSNEYQADASIKTKDAVAGAHFFLNNLERMYAANPHMKIQFAATHPEPQDRLKNIQEHVEPNLA